MVYELIKEQPEQPRGWDSTVDDYLASNDICYTEATPLQGGYSAYVWRVDGYQDPASKSRRREPCVLKYADEAAKRVPQMALDKNRMRFEARALKSVSVKSACDAEPNVKVPEVLRTTDRALLMTWGGEKSLRAAIESGQGFDAYKIGSRLGRWLACLHEAGINDPEAAEWENSTFMNPVKAGEYQRLRSSMLANGFDDSIVDRAIDRLETPVAKETVTAWDFRPSNTLLRMEGHPEGEPGLTVIDWEANAFGCPVWDLAFWVTETVVLEAKHMGTRTLVSSFLASYLQMAGDKIVTDKFAAKLALLVGSSLNYLVPRGFWASTEEEVQFWKGRAMQLVRAGLDQDIEWIAASEIGALLQDNSQTRAD